MRLDFDKCQHASSHVWSLKVPASWETHLEFESASKLVATFEL